MKTIDFNIERLILKTGNKISNIRDDDLKKYDLTSSQSETILYYAEHGGESIKDLAVHLKITHQAARKLVEKLRQKNILETIASEEDRRFTKVYLTGQGRNLYANLKQNGSATGENILEGFSEEEKKLMLAYMKRIEKNLDEK